MKPANTRQPPGLDHSSSSAHHPLLDPPSYSTLVHPSPAIIMAEKTDLPTRSNTTATNTTIATNATSDDEAVPEGDPSTTTGLLMERVQAWKHMCGYLEGYITAVSKDEKTQAKEQERILKVLWTHRYTYQLYKLEG